MIPFGRMIPGLYEVIQYTLSLPPQVFAVSFSPPGPDGRSLLAAGGFDMALRVWDASSGAARARVGPARLRGGPLCSLVPGGNGLWAQVFNGWISWRFLKAARVPRR